MSAWADILRGPQVEYSAELDRIAKLPRNESLETGFDEGSLRRPGSTAKLFPVQSQALNAWQHTIAKWETPGLFCPIGVGRGKTLITFLAPRMYKSKRAVILTYANLVEKTLSDWVQYRRDWHVSEELRVISWEKISQAGFEFPPETDLVIADECQAIRNFSAARTKKFLRLINHNRSLPLIALSGSITTRSIKDYAHIISIALGEHSPVPRQQADLDQWSEAIDAKLPWGVSRRDKGELGLLGPGTAREAYQGRLLSATGVVGTTEDTLGAGLEIHIDNTDIVPGARRAQEACLAERLLPDGESIYSPEDCDRHSRTLALGYWLTFLWPDGKKDVPWLVARSRFTSAIETFLETCTFADSPAELKPLLLTKDPRVDSLQSVWQAWTVLASKAPPISQANWLPRAQDVLASWVRRHSKAAPRTIVWTESPHIGKALSTALDWPYYGAGYTGAWAKQPVIASWRAHGIGKNLQWYDTNIILQPPSNNARLEQLLGRTHRHGQEAENVKVILSSRSDPGGFARCIKEARYTQSTTGQAQKIVLASIFYLDGIPDIK